MTVFRRDNLIFKVEGNHRHIVDIQNQQYYMIANQNDCINLSTRLLLAKIITIEKNFLKLYTGDITYFIQLLNMTEGLPPSMWICVEFLVQYMRQTGDNQKKTANELASLKDDFKLFKTWVLLAFAFLIMVHIVIG